MTFPIVQNRVVAAGADPAADLVALLRPHAARWGGAECTGRWGLSFRARGDILVCWLERGGCRLQRPGHEAIGLAAGDVLLIRATAPFALASDPGAAHVDSEAARPGPDGRFLLGGGNEAPVTIEAGRILFDAAGATPSGSARRSDGDPFLTDLLPEVVHLAASEPDAARARARLSDCRAEMARPGHGSRFVVTRLLELALVELLRHGAAGRFEGRGGLLAGLGDPMTARALRAIHHAPARAWTVARLASTAGASRSTFAGRFRAVVGESPMSYVARWRLTLAGDELLRGRRSVEQIAVSVGFESASAFSTAFRRATGVSPRRYGAGRLS